MKHNMASATQAALPGRAASAGGREAMPAPLI
jgi:hypothetical protein